jgi:hypothetical protein
MISFELYMKVLREFAASHDLTIAVVCAEDDPEYVTAVLVGTPDELEALTCDSVNCTMTTPLASEAV